MCVVEVCEWLDFGYFGSCCECIYWCGICFGGVEWY